MNVDQLQAGRKLDALVAKKLGWREAEDASGDLEGEKWLPPEPDGDRNPVRLPQFSTDRSTAMALMEHVPLQGKNAAHLRFDANGLFSCRIGPPGDDVDDDAWRYHSTFPVAICRAIVAMA